MKGTGNLSVLFLKLACHRRHGLVHSVKLNVWDSVENKAWALTLTLSGNSWVICSEFLFLSINLMLMFPH